MNHLRWLSLTVLLLPIVLVITACGYVGAQPDEPWTTTPPTTLRVPEIHVTYDGLDATFSWLPVARATGFRVYFNNTILGDEHIQVNSYYVVAVTLVDHLVNSFRVVALSPDGALFNSQSTNLVDTRGALSQPHWLAIEPNHQASTARVAWRPVPHVSHFLLYVNGIRAATVLPNQATQVEFVYAIWNPGLPNEYVDVRTATGFQLDVAIAPGTNNFRVVAVSPRAPEFNSENAWTI